MVAVKLLGVAADVDDITLHLDDTSCLHKHRVPSHPVNGTILGVTVRQSLGQHVTQLVHRQDVCQHSQMVNLT
jgi:hypothetical protein